MSIFFKNFGPYSKLRTANWPIAWRKQTQPYNKGDVRHPIMTIRFPNSAFCRGDHMTVIRFRFVFFHILCFNCRYPYESKSEPIKVFQLYPNALAPLIQGLRASGFTLLPANPPVPRLFLPCPVGTFSNSSNQGTEGCTPCPAGIRLVIYMLFTGWENNKKVIHLPRSACIGRNCARGLEYRPRP